MYWPPPHKLYFCQLPIILLFYSITLVVCRTFEPVYNYSAGLPVDPPVAVHKCQPPETWLCNIDTYQTIQPFRNSFGHDTLAAAVAELHKHAYLLMSNQPSACKSKMQLFLCSLYTPVCPQARTTTGQVVVLDTLLLPCREQCEKARELCKSDLRKGADSDWPEDWRCDKFKYFDEDRMCVKDNDDQTREINETICPPDLFDCRVDDPSLDRKALCIERGWVCDGKKDCDNGRDEVGCPKKCVDGLIDCDGKCLSKSDICTRKLKCTGLDDQDCNNFLDFLVNPIFGIFSLSGFIYACIRIFKSDKEEPDMDETPKEIVSLGASSHSEEEIANPDCHEHQSVCSNFYERINPGGHSGASSMIYATYGLNISIDNIRVDVGDKPTPPAPPSTPPAPPPTPAPSTPGPQSYIYNDY